MKLLSRILIALLCGLVSANARAQNKPMDFTGKWALDKTKTQRLPATLESYSMEIRQDAEQLLVILKITMQGVERIITSKDRWELTKEGHLLVRRSVELPMGAEEVKLLLTKQS